MSLDFPLPLEFPPPRPRGAQGGGDKKKFGCFMPVLSSPEPELNPVSAQYICTLYRHRVQPIDLEFSKLPLTTFVTVVPDSARYH